MAVAVSGMGTITVGVDNCAYSDGVLVPELSKLCINHVSASLNVVGAVTEDGHVWTWGVDTSGGLGDGSSRCRFRPPRRIPPHIFGGGKVRMVCPAESHLAVLTEDGRVFTSGDSLYGALGLGDRRGLQRYVFLLTRITDPEFTSVPTESITAAKGKTVVRRADGTFYTWGANTGGNLGLGHDECVLSPRLLDVPACWAVVSMSAAFLHTAIVTEDGTFCT